MSKPVDMAETAKTLSTILTPGGVTAWVASDEPGQWKFEIESSADDGCEIVTVSLTAPEETRPPKFGILFRVSGAGATNVWTSDWTLDSCHMRPGLWWGSASRYKSSLASETPIAAAFGPTGRATVVMACSEAMEKLVFGLYADERDGVLTGRYEFFRDAVAPRNCYVAKVRIDRRGLDVADAVRDATGWIVAQNGFAPAPAPEAAFEPLYSSWYAFLQDVDAASIEAEAPLAASMGMKTLILDDGWQKEESGSFYSATGDWMPAAARFPDMKAHVARVHASGLKYMVWVATPFMGKEARNYARFKGKFLFDGDTAVLDPRFPEVREYLAATCERIVRDWDFDGVKLDFIDAFVLPERDPAEKDGYSGRDCRSLPLAVDMLMKGILARMKAAKPDVLVEFRQRYMGPAMLQYGNMIRATDCPLDPSANRRRICDLRLTSRGAAVHSDMLSWSPDETPAGAALPILNALYSTIQYSMRLGALSLEHTQVVRRWLGFSQAHREALLKGAFRPHHPEYGYTWVEGESDSETVTAIYEGGVVAYCSAGKPLFLVNATGSDGLLAELPIRPVRFRVFDVLGRECPVSIPDKGLVRLPIPSGGHGEMEIEN